MSSHGVENSIIIHFCHFDVFSLLCFYKEKADVTGVKSQLQPKSSTSLTISYGFCNKPGMVIMSLCDVILNIDFFVNRRDKSMAPGKFSYSLGRLNFTSCSFYS